MQEKTFTIEGMSCQHCVKAVELELDELKLDSYKVEVGSAKVKYDETFHNEKQIKAAIAEAGFKVI